ncbi:uncharacterized protein [Antedon mediterranea]|uniref:uncharacterized protein n=1 Tax=Antedon mediterranea TaxID=105859 RepID=UPI003AF68290
MSRGKTESGEGLFSNLFTTKPTKGVTKQRGKSKDRYHEDPPEPLPGEYDSDEEGHYHSSSKEKSFGSKSKMQSLFTTPNHDKPEHRAKSSSAKVESSRGRETPKKSKLQSLFGSADDSKSSKKKSQDRYHQKNPHEKKPEKGESKGGKSSGLGEGLFSSGSGTIAGNSGKTKVGKSKGHSSGRQQPAKGASFSFPSF